MMINDCYRSTSFINNPATTGPADAVAHGSAPGTPNGVAAADGTTEFGDGKGAQTVPTTMGGIAIGNIIDPRFLRKNTDFLYDPNTLERQDLDDEKSCAIADS